MAKNGKKNNLNTKNIPPLLMLTGGLISLIICIVMKYDTRTLLIVVFLSLFIFSIIGLIIKIIADSFDMHVRYEDFFDDIDDGDVYTKSGK